MQKWIILGVILIILFLGTYIVFNVNIETDYTPEIEIDESNLRKTIISLYFYNKENNTLEKETRLIDSKELLKEPYEKVIKMLINGPESENLNSLIPSDTELVETKLEEDILIIKLKSNLISELKDENIKNQIVEELSKTMCEFKEINSINIIIEEKSA